MRPVNRIQPKLPAGAYQTFALSAPLATHFRAGTCAEVGDCEPYQNGWRTTVDETTELGQQQAHYIRKIAGRAFKESRGEGGLTVFEFPAGQQCFRTHRVRIDRPEHCLAWRGDWRVQPRRDDITVFQRGDQWVDSFAEHQDKLATALERG